MPAFNAPRMDVAASDSVSQPCTRPGGRARRSVPAPAGSTSGFMRAIVRRVRAGPLGRHAGAACRRRGAPWRMMLVTGILFLRRVSNLPAYGGFD